VGQRGGDGSDRDAAAVTAGSTGATMERVLERR
jgi:hypothetical protein